MVTWRSSCCASDGGGVSTGRKKVVVVLVLRSFLRVSSVRTNKRDLHADLRAGSNRLISNRFGSRRVSFFLLLLSLSLSLLLPSFLSCSLHLPFTCLHLPVLSFRYSTADSVPLSLSLSLHLQRNGESLNHSPRSCPKRCISAISENLDALPESLIVTAQRTREKCIGSGTTK